ncbi:nodulin homeobox isoform X2 [Ricinus communis]|uniref:nodulin homeobox isoform X2 n=1 Tax=Ricinus communis TaxID=3988 RepID=UPI0007722FDB|nr:nodulin homeobox isoform X2 [Ricinus communis]|eukprot:XP_015575672.1 nodulin homeobox isoform X2 [Ricinus communis]
MRLAKDESSCIAEQVIDLISAVKELHWHSSQELNKLIRDSENFTIHFLTEKGSNLKIDVEKLAGFLPLHLIAVLMSSDKDESLLRYLLCGIRLLHSLCDLAPRHTKLEQILLDDVKVSEQLLDLVFYVLIVLSGIRQEKHNSSSVPLLHPALVACSLYLLTGCISSHWQDLVQVLLAHPKVDVFMDAAFGAVLVAIRFLQVKLSAPYTDFHMRSSPTAEQIVNYLCQQCEASLQFLQSLCQQKLFRERLLRNKELCGKGGVLFLAQAILKLNIIPPFIESSTVVAAVSRLKAKVLSILLHLCEAESISYLDEVASSPGSFDLAKSVALEVLELLKAALSKDPKHLTASSERTFPMGLLRLNAMRLADIFSDDSNFRSYITTCFTKVLTAIFSLPHGEFLSIWCSSELPLREEDATLEFDIFIAAGWVLDTISSLNLSNALNSEITLIPSNMPQATYAHQRTSLFVKVIANLHCFVPNICEEQERNLFLHKFLECMRMDPSETLPEFSFTSDANKANTVCRNLRSLLSHAESLIPNFLNEEDVQLLRVFFNQLQSLINTADFEQNQVQEIKFERSISLEKFCKLDINEHQQEAQSTGGYSSALSKKELSNRNISSNRKEEISENSAFLEEEQLSFRNEHMKYGDDAMREEKDKSGGTASTIKREIDRDFQNIETSGSDTSSTRGKNFAGQLGNSDFPKSSEHKKENGLQGVQEGEKVETIQFEEKQPRKRKRTIMNEYQMSLIEEALVDEPDMHRNAASLQSWADKLSLHGSEVTSSQLKNWLNNRKARLARAGAGKDVRTPMEVDHALSEKQSVPALRHSHDSSESHGEVNVPAELVQCKPGQYVVLVDKQGDEIGKGKVYQVQGKWYGKSLEESETCVVDVTELKAERWVRLPYPSEATGTSFSEAETKLGVMRVLWDSNKIFMSRPQ